jgi:protein tyrosine/serine phosphatase
MRTSPLFLLALLGCDRYVAAPPQTVTLEAPAEGVYRELRSVSGPTRFAQVDAHLYRGGQPTAAQVRRLHQLGIGTIVSLRGDDRDDDGEEATARELGIKFERVALNALSTPDGAVLRQIVALIQQSPNPVYVHCAQGRDRTSLIVALYRVWVNKWEPKRAWQREAREYGHAAPWFRGLDRAFAAVTGP